MLQVYSDITNITIVPQDSCVKAGAKTSTARANNVQEVKLGLWIERWCTLRAGLSKAYLAHWELLAQGPK